MDANEKKALIDKFKWYEKLVAPALNQLVHDLAEARKRHDSVVYACMGLYELRKKIALKEAGLSEDNLLIAEKASKHGKNS